MGIGMVNPKDDVAISTTMFFALLSCDDKWAECDNQNHIWKLTICPQFQADMELLGHGSFVKNS